MVGEGENAGKEGRRGRRRGIFIFLTHCLCLISFSLCNSWFLITLLSPLIRARGVSLTVPHSVILSPLPLLKIKDTFITLHCLVMVSQGRSQSNNNSLISVYLSLPNRPKYFPNSLKTLSSCFILRFSTAPFISLLALHRVFLSHCMSMCARPKMQCTEI